MYSLRLLGGVALEGPSGPLSGPAVQQRRLAVLAMLAACGEKGCSRDKLVGFVWPEREEERARHVLATAVYVLRNAMGEEAVLSTGEYLRLNSEVVQSDVQAFEEAFEEAVESGRIEEAVEAYGGPFLEGFHLKGAPEFERWVESERERLNDRYAGALEKLAGQAEAAGEYPRAVDMWKRLAALDAYNSRFVLHLMETLVAAGDPGNAVQRAQEHGRILREDLNAEPAPEVRELAERLRREAVGPREESERSAAALGQEGAEPPPGLLPRPGPAQLPHALAIYAAVSFAVVVIAHIFTLQFGLPDWFFRSAVVVLIACLLAVVVTAFIAGTPAARGWVSWRNTVAFIAVAFAVLGIAVAGYMATRAMGVGPWGTLIGRGVLEEQDLIVLADFEEHSGDSTLARIVTDLVRIGLDQSPAVKVANRAYVRGVLQQMTRSTDGPLSDELAREVATRGGLKAVLTGAIHRSGSSYIVSARLEAAETGEVLESFREQAEHPDSIISAADRLSASLRERIGESLKTIRSSPPLKQVRTHSLESLRLYTEAVWANIHERDFRRACDLTSRAIEIDTLFIAAIRLRAHCHTNLGINQAQIIADATRAYELRHLAIPKERYNTEGVYHQMVTGDLEALIHAWRMVLEIDPGWDTAYNQMGGAYYSLHDYARAEEMFRRRLELDTLAAVTRSGLARSQFNQGKSDEAEETLRQWEEKTPGHPDILLIRATLASAQGDFAAAEGHLRVMRDRIRGSRLYSARTSRQLAYLAQVQGKVAEAESHFRDAMAAYEEAERPVERLACAIELAGMQAWFLGDTVRAVETVRAELETRPLESIEPIDRPYPALAGFYAFVGEPEQARETLMEWEVIVPPDLRRRQEVSRRLGWSSVAMAEDRPEDALAELRLAQKRDRCPICQLPLLGGLYESLGQADSALAVYGRFLTTPYAERCLPTPYTLRALGGTSPAAGFDPFWLPVVYARLGAQHEQRGDTVKAIDYYGRLVNLWNDADPELQPRVAAARRAMNSLSASH
jgi:DNA-binding SARP family transcriptional activator/Flp pilus assembly protein TadD